MNCTWYTEDCLGSDHLPITIEVNENIKDDEPEDEDKIPKLQYKHADWEAYQAFLLSSDINDTKTLLHLSISLVRSKLIYGQEVYFSAPNTLL